MGGGPLFNKNGFLDFSAPLGYTFYNNQMGGIL